MGVPTEMRLTHCLALPCATSFERGGDSLPIYRRGNGGQQVRGQSQVAQLETRRARSHTWTLHSSLEARMVGAETEALVGTP